MGTSKLVVVHYDRRFALFHFPRPAAANKCTSFSKQNQFDGVRSRRIQDDGLFLYGCSTGDPPLDRGDTCFGRNESIEFLLELDSVRRCSRIGSMLYQLQHKVARAEERRTEIIQPSQEAENPRLIYCMK